MGIDGGGSNLRVVITDKNLHSLVEAYRGSVNPSLVGRTTSAQLIQDAVSEALSACGSDEIASVGIGVAGASKSVSEQWLRDVLHPILPNTVVVPASDNEIALVGANGKREGILLLAGTGSVGYGVNPSGEELQVGGWGYIFGDEGSGYWLGMQTLKLVAEAIDTNQFNSLLVQKFLDAYGIRQFGAMINWLYHNDKGVPVARVAKLAPLVLEAANRGDEHAINIIEIGSDALVKLAQILKTRLDMPYPDYAFAGGLLTSENVLSQGLVEKLGLDDYPQALYPPMIGAALLAKIRFEEREANQR